MLVPFLSPSISAGDILRMISSIRTGWLVHGPYTDHFEKDLAAYFHAKKAAMVSSATAALHLSLILAGVSDGDEVITTPLSWVATSNVVLYQRAKVVFADVERDTGILDADDVERKITARTKAIIVVHAYGQMADMKRLSEIGKKHHIPVIEDAAHAIEAMRDGVRPGELGLAACLSFHAAKNITSGQGGAVIANDPMLVEKIKLLRRDGVRNIDGKRVMLELGYKYDATDFQAALLIGQLKRIEKNHAIRATVFERYTELLKDIPNIRIPVLKPRSRHACHMFIVWVEPSRRDAIRAYMESRNVQTSIHYNPIHLEPYYRSLGFKPGDLPVAEELGASTITLPTHTSLTRRQQRYVIQILKEALSNA